MTSHTPTQKRVCRAQFCRTAFAGVSLLVYGLSATIAQEAPQDPANPPVDNRAFALAPHFLKGQISRYQTQSNLAVKFSAEDKTKANLTFQFGMDATMRYIVREVRSDGSVTLAALSDGGNLLDITGQNRELKKEPDNYPRAVTFARQGKLLALKDTGKKDANPLDAIFDLTNLMVQLHFLPLPEQAVKIGDTWSARYPLPNAREAEKARAKPDKNRENKTEPDAEEATTIEAKLTLLGTQKVGELETLKIKQVVTVPYDAMADVNGKATTDPAKATGRMKVRLTFTQTVIALPETGQVLQSNGEVEGEIKLEGTLGKQAPGDTLTLTGKVAAIRIAASAKGPQK